ncbi:MAG TPA: sortase [Candidatus Saccharimonadales bacterium]
MADHPHNSDDTQGPKDGFVLPRSNPGLTPQTSKNEAADLIRDKLAKLYASEPDALQEEREAEAVTHRSKHQQFMHDLNHSGKNLAEIQTEWHNYYVSLPDDEKHVVWQEFYANSEAAQQQTAASPTDGLNDAEKLAVMRNQLASHNPAAAPAAQPDNRSTTAIQHNIRETAGGKRRRGKPSPKQHLKSLLFGLAVGFVCILVFLFGFFNEVIIAPFIQPARTSAATPIIMNSNTVAPSSEPQVIIPKINVQIPIQFDVAAPDEATMQKALDSGVAHYPTTSNPGQNGNSAYFGHSSNNIFNKGKYKFAFVLLHQLVPGDTFYITKDGKIYAYKVFDKKIVEPNQVEVLDPVADHPATATLITCDPPGTSLRRLVIVGDQISPDPSTNVAASTNTDISSETELTAQGPTLLGRFISHWYGKVILILAIIATFGIVIYKTRPQY